VHNLEKRIHKLEHRFGTACDDAAYVITMADRELSAEERAYVEMLHKPGSFPGGVVSIVDFMSIPPGLTAIEIDRFVRENRAKANGSEPRVLRESGHRTPIIHVELE
jgi:hypothetical protein